MITIYDWFGYKLPIKERYRLIKETGFDGVMLWWSEFLDRNDYRNGPQIVREAGLYIENIHAPFQVQDYIWLDNLDGESTLDCYLQCVADCSAFEIPTMVVHLPDDDKPCNELGLDRIRRIAEKAEQLCVNIALENLRNFANLSYILDHVDSMRLGLCYDCCHHYHYYPDCDLLSKYGLRLMALHLHDYKGNATHLLPFDGAIDWSAAMKKITETGYPGPTAIEAMNWSYKDLPAENFLSEAFDKAKRLEAFRYIEGD
jgi:L-ribulose-5-phosphate 3-epimerase